MQQNPQYTIIKTPPKHHNQCRSVWNESIRWLQIATDKGKKLKVETEVKERYQQVLDSIYIDVINIEQQHSSDKDIITPPMNPIINSSFNKHTMSWELIHLRLIHPYDSVIKAMCCHQTLTGLPKYLSKKLNQA